MDPTNRKTRIREYKQTPREAGIYRVRNTGTGRSLVGSTTDLPGRLNRHRFQLKMGSHPDAALQKDWKELGEAAFSFDVLDRLEPRDEPGYDPRAELDTLRELWLEKLAAAGEPLYDTPASGTG
ncbi:GIY-YIG nuclease family protein [bacterium]|nr:GIY-YIG nuclease family protein [bacterium]